VSQAAFGRESMAAVSAAEVAQFRATGVLLKPPFFTDAEAGAMRYRGRRRRLDFTLFR